MNASVNRQILLVEKPSGKLGPEHFKLIEGAMPEPKDGEALLRVRYISLDAANRAWMHGATYRSAVEANSVMAGGGHCRSRGIQNTRTCTRRSRVGRYRLAGVCRRPRQASVQGFRRWSR